MKEIKTNDCMWVLAVILIASIALPNYVARELFAAMLLFTALFLIAAVLLGSGLVAWHAIRRFMDWEPLRNIANEVRRFTEGVWAKTFAG